MNTTAMRDALDTAKDILARSQVDTVSGEPTTAIVLALCYLASVIDRKTYISIDGIVDVQNIQVEE